MQYITKKLDGRYSHKKYFKYCVEFSKKQQGPLQFHTVTKWMIETYGYAAEIRDWQYILDLHEQHRKHYSIVKSFDRWAKVNPHVVISPSQYTTPNEEESVKQDALSRYRTYTDQEGMYTWLFHMGFLYDLLVSKDVECYFWFFNQNPEIMPQHIQDYMFERFPMLWDSDKSTLPQREVAHPDYPIINFEDKAELRNAGRRPMWKYERIHDILDNGDSHPSILGHEQIADHIIESIEKLNAKKKTILRRP